MKNLIIFCSAILVQIFAQNFPIGHTTMTFQDPSRGNRPIETEIYYPAVTAGEDVLAESYRPVIIFGHGFVMAWSAYQNIWEHLVPKGYILAFPRTEGNIMSTDHQQFGWDLQFLVQAMEDEGADANSLLYNAVAPSFALMGHSMGGGAAFLAADSLCRNGNLTLKALIGLAPAESSTNGVSSIASAAYVTVPSLIMSGVQDGVTPPVDHHIPMYNALGSDCKTLVHVTGGAHCYFANSNFNCDFGESTASTGISITREEQQDVANDYLTLYLDYVLNGNCTAWNDFQDTLMTSTRTSNEQSCLITPMPSISENGGVLSSTETATSYQWYKDGVLIAGAESQDYTPTESGNYTVELSNPNACSRISAPYQWGTTVGISNSAFKNVKVFPNPADHSLKIEGALGDYQILDCTGSLVEIGKVQNGMIDISGFAPGVYYLNLEGARVSFVKK